jgi:hypothetical protein
VVAPDNSIIRWVIVVFAMKYIIVVRVKVMQKEKKRLFADFSQKRKGTLVYCRRRNPSSTSRACLVIIDVETPAEAQAR